MKTFRDLKIGDSIFSVASQKSVVRETSSNGYVVHSGDIYDKKDVRSMEVKEDHLSINRHTSYHGVTFDFKIPIQELDSYSFTKGGVIIFVEEKLAFEFIKQRVVEAIKYEEARIPDIIKNVEENIKSIRQRYYHILNNVEHEIELK